jgi:hypothetical protein
MVAYLPTNVEEPDGLVGAAPCLLRRSPLCGIRVDYEFAGRHRLRGTFAGPFLPQRRRARLDRGAVVLHRELRTRGALDNVGGGQKHIRDLVPNVPRDDWDVCALALHFHLETSQFHFDLKSSHGVTS